MKSKNLTQYNGILSPAEIAIGMNAASNNATRLLDDARLLFGQGRWAGSVTLAILSIEESGKISILRSLAVAREVQEAKGCWKEYRSHLKKNIFGGLPDLVRKGARNLEDFRALFDSKSEHPILIEQLKQISMYSDCYGNRHWSDPAHIVDRELAEQFIGTAGILSSKHVVTTREVELWVSYVGPVWKQEMSIMKEAVANWYSAMKAESLINGEDQDMNRFLWPSAFGMEKK